MDGIVPAHTRSEKVDRNGFARRCFKSDGSMTRSKPLESDGGRSLPGPGRECLGIMFSDIQKTES